MKENACLPFGTRFVEDEMQYYCDISKSFAEQKEKDQLCQNNYECKTNQCSDGVCSSIREELEETRGLLERILRWLERIFG